MGRLHGERVGENVEVLYLSHWYDMISNSISEGMLYM